MHLHLLHYGFYFLNKVVSFSWVWGRSPHTRSIHVCVSCTQAARQNVIKSIRDSTRPEKLKKTLDSMDKSMGRYCDLLDELM